MDGACRGQRMRKDDARPHRLRPHQARRGKRVPEAPLGVLSPKCLGQAGGTGGLCRRLRSRRAAPQAEPRHRRWVALALRRAVWRTAKARAACLHAMGASRPTRGRRADQPRGCADTRGHTEGPLLLQGRGHPHIARPRAARRPLLPVSLHAPEGDNPKTRELLGGSQPGGARARDQLPQARQSGARSQATGDGGSAPPSEGRTRRFPQKCA